MATRLLPLWLDGLSSHVRAAGAEGRVSHPTFRGGTATIAVAGPLDAGALGQLRAFFAEAAEQRRNIALDLTEATTLDTAAAGLLLLAYGMQLRMQRTITIVGENRAIRRRLTWHGCCDLFQPQRGFRNAVRSQRGGPKPWALRDRNRSPGPPNPASS